MAGTSEGKRQQKLFPTTTARSKVHTSRQSEHVEPKEPTQKSARDPLAEDPPPSARQGRTDDDIS